MDALRERAISCDARGKGRNLNRNQKAAARGLSLAAYLLSSGGKMKDEGAIREHLPAYRHLYESSLGAEENEDRAADALRKQLRRDVEALREAGVEVEVEGNPEGRRYRLSPANLQPAELDLTGEERAVLIGALRALRRGFPYEEPLRLALANLIGAASAGAWTGDGVWDQEEAAAFAVVTARDDGAVAGRIAVLERAISRRKRVRFVYYAISQDETSEREVEPYALSLLDGSWYLTGWDAGREGLRQFRLSRIEGRVVFATKRDGGDFEVPENFERRIAGPRAPWQLGRPDKTASIRITPEAYAAARRDYGFAVSVGRDEHGRVLVTPYSGERQLAGWILSLGEGAEVLSPGPLVGRVREGLERIAAAHDERYGKDRV